MDLAEEHRLHLHRRFHDRDHDTHRALARSYLATERIGLNFDDVEPGLSRYIHDAINANADRAGPLAAALVPGCLRGSGGRDGVR
jgi:hypothetical protein